MALGNYETALSYASRALACTPNIDPSYWIIVAANAHLGRMTEVRRYLEKLRALCLGLTIELLGIGQPSKTHVG